MIFLDEMKNMKIYRKQFFLPYNDKDKKHGSVVYLLTPNFSSSKNLINSAMTINRRYFESYYFERNAAYYIKTGKPNKDELLEAVEEQINSAIHNGYNYEAFDEYSVSKSEEENPTYYPSIKAAILANKLDDGDYNVYIHPVNHPELPTYIGKINVIVYSYSLYDAFYKWVDWEEVEDEGESIDESYLHEGIDPTKRTVKKIINNPVVNGTSEFWTSPDGIDNAIVHIKGSNEKFRGRSELLIINGNSIFLEKDKYGLCTYGAKMIYNVPGGSWDSGEDHFTSALREAKEEARIIAENPVYTGSYAVIYDAPHRWVQEKIPKNKQWKGYYSEVYIATYKSKYAGHIDDADKDEEMAKKGKFYPIEEVYDKLNEVHRIAIDKYFGKSPLFEANFVDESYIINEKDIYYNKDKFDSGEINLCFIIGHSGAGKSTMAKNMSDNKTVEYYELDDVVWNKMAFTMDNFKKYGDLIYSFFAGPGKKYYYTDEDIKEGKVKPVGDNYEELLINDFIKYAKSYANSHKNKKFVVEGIWIVDFTNPVDFKDYAFYIKGTSVLVSRWRAARRDSKDAPEGQVLRARVGNFFNSHLMKEAIGFEKDLASFRRYFSDLEKKSMHEQTDPLDNDYTEEIIRRYNVKARDGSDNACVYVKGYEKPMRGRSSILILREIDGEMHVFCDFYEGGKALFSNPGDIRAPGGGWNVDETPRDAAIREAGEETFMAVKDVRHCGCHIEYSDSPYKVADWVRENVPEEDWWYGYYSETFVGVYDGPYGKEVAPEDLDDIAEKGKWIPLSEFYCHEPASYIRAVRDYLTMYNVNILEDALLEISKADEEKNNTLVPVFVVNTYTGSPFGKIIRKTTNAEYSHTLIAFTPSLKKMYTFDFGKKIIDDDLEYRNIKGFCIDNIDRYRAAKIQNIEVLCLMVPPKVKLSLEKSVDWYRANVDSTMYGFSNLFDYLKGSKKLDSFGDMKLFCSEFVDAILKKEKIDISGHSSRNSAPKDMGSYTDTNNIFKIYTGRAVDYSEEEVMAEIEKLKATIPYKKLNALRHKVKLNEEGEEGAANVVDAADVKKQMKSLLRRLKMKARRGVYKLNKDLRSTDSNLPTVQDIQNTVNTGTPAPAAAHPTTEQVKFISDLQAALKYEDENRYFINEDAIYIFNEAEARFDTPLRKILWNDRLRSNKEVLQLYTKVKTEIPSIKYTFIQPDRYGSRNLWYDLSFYTELFFKNNTFKLDKAVDLYFDFLSRLLDPARLHGNYTKKAIFIPVMDWNTAANKKTWLYRDGINPISVLFRMMGKDMSKVKSLFKNTELVFFGQGNYFKINFSTLTMEEEKQLANRFKTYINKMTSNIPFNVEEIDGTPDSQESNKVIVTNIVDKIEKAQKVDMSTQSKYIATITTAKAFTGTPTPAKPILSPSTPRTINPKDNSKELEKQVKEDIKKEKEEAKEIVNKTTFPNTIPEEAKKQKEIDTAGKEREKKEIIERINSIASQSTNTDDAIENLDNDDEIKALIMQLAAEENAGVKINRARTDRMAQLSKDFQEKEVHGMKIKDILDPEYQMKEADAPLPTTTVKVDSPFKDEWSDLTYINFNKTYDINEDIVRMLNALSTKQYPIAIRNLEIQNTSTSEDYIDTYIIEIEDFRGKRSTLKLDIPKFKDNKYLILRGNKKTIQNQSFNMPILKTDVDTVQIISNYNKIFIRRFGNSRGKTISYADKLAKALNKYDGTDITKEPGDNSKISDNYDLPIDYIDLGSIFNTITIKGKDEKAVVYFNQDVIREKYSNLIDLNMGIPYMVVTSNQGTHIRYFNARDFKYEPFSAQLVNYLNKSSAKFKELYESTSAAKKYVYSQASILNQKIPLVIICAFSEGLLPVLKKANIEYELKEKITRDDRKNPMLDFIQFSDGYLVYPVTYDSSLLLNGLKEVDTTEYSIMDVNNKSIYTEMLDDFGGRLIADGLENFYECMLDPITVEVLMHYKLPTDYITLLTYSNALLADNSYISHGDVSSRRIRKNELIAVKVYKTLFNDAYSSYATAIRHNNKSASTFSVKQSAVIDKFMTDTISSDLSVANCLNDIETINSVTTKGDSGMNSERSYTLDKRIYDKSMLNILGLSTGFANTVGVTRQATINMSIDGKRGYAKPIEGDISKMNTANSLTITEALGPMGSTHDDPIRTAMTFTQTAKHQVRTAKSDPLLVTNGADAVLPYIVSDIFCKKAEKAGKVIELIPDKYMIINYDEKENEYIDLSPRIEKNSDGGFYVKVKFKTDLKEGDKVKQGEIIAYDDTSFTKGSSETKELLYDVGRLSKIAIINSDDNFEDSAMITSKLAKDLATSIINKEERYLEANTNIYNWRKVGETVQQEDILYETQTSYEEEDVNALLKSLAGDKDQISKLGRKPVKSPVTGTIVGIKVYRTCELEDMSENMRKFFNEMEKDSKQVLKKLNSLGINDPTITGSTEKLKPIGKLKNRENSVLIEYYIEYHDIMGLGDKLSYWSANKGTIHSIVDSNNAPYTDFRPNEEISAFTGISSINKRQIASNILIGSLNKLMIELGRSVRDIMGIPPIDNELDQ